VAPGPILLWRQPNDAIYVVRHDEDHQTFVVFGDGELGQRLPTGVNNVVATYRYGVGGNVPANSITALEKPIKGVRKVFNPLPATGGKEPPTPEQQRREAPLSTLVLGRLVSLPDFEAETRRYGNVVSAKARWGWDDSGEDAVVQVWFATRDAGDPSAELRSYLQGMAEPNARIHVIKAKPSSKALRIELEIDPRFRAQLQPSIPRSTFLLHTLATKRPRSYNPIRIRCSRGRIHQAPRPRTHRMEALHRTHLRGRPWTDSTRDQRLEPARVRDGSNPGDGAGSLSAAASVEVGVHAVRFGFARRGFCFGTKRPTFAVDESREPPHRHLGVAATCRHASGKPLCLADRGT